MQQLYDRTHQRVFWNEEFCAVWDLTLRWSVWSFSWRCFWNLTFWENIAAANHSWSANSLPWSEVRVWPYPGHDWSVSSAPFSACQKFVLGSNLVSAGFLPVSKPWLWASEQLSVCVRLLIHGLVVDGSCVDLDCVSVHDWHLIYVRQLTPLSPGVNVWLSATRKAGIIESG